MSSSKTLHTNRRTFYVSFKSKTDRGLKNVRYSMN